MKTEPKKEEINNSMESFTYTLKIIPVLICLMEYGGGIG